jgi:uncharacterized membrane protein
MHTLRWQPMTSLVLSIAGICVSIYLTLTHFSSAVTLSCPAGGGAINCEKVTTSPQSYVFGIPVAVLGLVFFIPMLILCLPAAWRSWNRWIHLARLLLSVAGVGMIIYLISAELFTIKAICLWCTSVHVITFLLFVLIVTTAPIVLAADEQTEAADYVGAAKGVGSE